MTTNIVPPQDPRYLDSGRREAVINGRPFPCAISEIPEGHPDRPRARFMVTCRWTGVRPGMVITANATPYSVVLARDPNRGGPPNMERRFIEILCNPLSET